MHFIYFGLLQLFKKMFDFNVVSLKLVENIIRLGCLWGRITHSEISQHCNTKCLISWKNANTQYSSSCWLTYRYRSQNLNSWFWIPMSQRVEYYLILHSTTVINIFRHMRNIFKIRNIFIELSNMCTLFIWLFLDFKKSVIKLQFLHEY